MGTTTLSSAMDSLLTGFKATDQWKQELRDQRRCRTRYTRLRTGRLKGITLAKTSSSIKGRNIVIKIIKTEE